MSEDNVIPLFKDASDTDLPVMVVDDEPQIAEAESAGQEVSAPQVEAPYHAILKVWWHMTDPEHQSRHLPPTPDWCAVLIARWPFLKFSDAGVVQRVYFELLDEVRNILEQVHADNAEAFEVTDREEDHENKDLYIHLLIEWQKALFAFQSTWRYDDPEAAPKMAALGEVQDTVLGSKGLTSFLGVAGFPFNADDQAYIDGELFEFRQALDAEEG